MTARRERIASKPYIVVGVGRYQAAAQRGHRGYTVRANKAPDQTVQDPVQGEAGH
jgi:hypothetical protein